MGNIVNTFPKEERLNSKNNIDLLFKKGESFVHFPFRIVYVRLSDEDLSARAAMFVSVPKKKFKRAVKRNFLKRRVKESYRLNKSNLLSILEQKQQRLAIAFLYLDKEIRDYENIEKKMVESLEILYSKL
ncbi:MAG: ribonuclease P protein component [Bacteroidales bacterium]|nr:ribonuclease P protein component [Bacteroidales bacterium]